MKTTYENILSAIPVSVMARYDRRYGNSWYVPWLFQRELAPVLTVVVSRVLQIDHPGVLNCYGILGAIINYLISLCDVMSCLCWTLVAPFHAPIAAQHI